MPSTPNRTPSAAQYAHISTDGPFSAAVSSGSDLPSGDLPSTRRIDGTPAYGFRSNELLVSAPNAGAADSSRVVTITATGIANNRCIRHGAYTTRVPYGRMNEALQRILRQGGRVVSVVVSGDGNTAAPAPAAEAPAKEEKPKAKGRGRSKG
ncbi:phycobilisome linker polypeptide [Synechococcus sp. A10-1-5-1]|uniref:phycobilisome linker polypeptide n=1 Tax=Synechococcus sp. A10-1-5-1 TaxID=2936507 RepID=UPI00353025D4